MSDEDGKTPVAYAVYVAGCQAAGDPAFIVEEIPKAQHGTIFLPGSMLSTIFASQEGFPSGLILAVVPKGLVITFMWPGPVAVDKDKAH